MNAINLLHSINLIDGIYAIHSINAINSMDANMILFMSSCLLTFDVERAWVTFLTLVRLHKFFTFF